MITHQEVFDKGECLEHYPCDYNPEADTVESNFCVEALYLYEGSAYFLHLTFDRDTVYKPNEIAVPRPSF